MECKPAAWTFDHTRTDRNSGRSCGTRHGLVRSLTSTVNGDVVTNRFENRDRRRCSNEPLSIDSRSSRRESDRTPPLEVNAKEHVWLWESRRGVNIRAIARREGASVRRVRFGLVRARAQENSKFYQNSPRLPCLIPLFPVGPYTPLSSCGHRQPIPRGSLLCCMVCHRSGMDQHPALQRDWGREPIREKSSAVQEIISETRRHRRRRLFASRAWRIASETPR
jgi:hypothetical protein